MKTQHNGRNGSNCVVGLQRALAAALLTFAVVFFGFSASGAPITFTTPATIAGTNDVSLAGATLSAYTWATAAAPNNVPFTATTTSSGALGSFLVLSNFGSANATAFIGGAPFNSLPASYTNILKGSVYNGTLGNTAAVTFSNLSVGSTYQVQIWVEDPRSGEAARQENLIDPAGTYTLMEFNTTDAGGGVGQFAIGTFTADAPTETLLVAGVAGVGLPQINAMQFRLTTGIWSGTTDGNWNNADNSSQDFSGANYVAVKTIATNVYFGDTDASGNPVATSNVTITTGGVTGCNVNFVNRAVAYTLSSSDSLGLFGAYGLTVAGTNTVALDGTHTYTGGTAINSGTLALGSSATISGSSTINVASGATLDASAVNGGFSLGAGQTLLGAGTVKGVFSANAGAQIIPGTAGTAATISFNTNVTLNGQTITFDVGSSSMDKIVIGGTLTNNFNTTIHLNQINTGPLAGTNAIITFASLTGSGTFALDQTYRNVSLNVTATNVQLVIVGSGWPGSLTWAGGLNGNAWDLSTLNWLNGTLPTTYYQNAVVQFVDAGSSTPAVNLTTSLTNASLTVTCNTNAYTFSGAGQLSGPNGLTKAGTNSLTLANTNNYTGATTVSAGTLAISGGNNLPVASPTTFSGTSTFNLGGSQQMLANFTASSAAATSLTLTNGTLTVTNSGLFGPTSASAVTVNLRPNTTLIGTPGSLVQIGNSAVSGTSTVTFNHYGAATNQGTLYVGRPGVLNLDTNSTWYQSGPMSVNAQGGYASSLTINAGAAITYTGNNTVKIEPASANTGSGTLTIAGGTFTTSQAFERTMATSTGNGNLVVNSGGQIVLSASVPQLIAVNTGTATFTSGSGGAAINTAGWATEISVPVTGAGGLTKQGAGTLSLNAADTYSGNTLVNAGTLALDVNGSIASTPVITVTPGALFDVSLVSFNLNNNQTLIAGRASGFATDVNGTLINANGTINPAGNGIAGTLSVGGSLNLQGGTLNFDLSHPGGTNDEILATGQLDLSGTTTINVNWLGGLPQPGTYTLVNCATWDSGTTNNLAFGLGLTSGRVSYAFDTTSTPGAIKLVATGVGANLVWTGTNGSNWDVTTTTNWLNGIHPDEFFTGDNVNFTDSSTNGMVNIAAAVLPNAVLVNNNAQTYTFNSNVGQGITGGSLTKTGTGTLNILNINPYTGVTTINGGTLALGDGVSNDGSLTGSPVVNNATLEFNVASGQTVTTAISGTGTVVQTGNAYGTVYLQGTNTYNGGTTISSGTLEADNLAALPATGTVSVAPNCTLNLNVSGPKTWACNISGPGTVEVTLGNTSDNTYLAGNLSGCTGIFNLVGNSQGKLNLNPTVMTAWPAATAIFNVQNGATLYLNSGGNLTNVVNLYGGTIGEAYGQLRVDNATTNFGPVTLMADSSVGCYTGTGVIAGPIGDGGNALALTVEGAATLLMTGTNTYTGATTVSSGTLMLQGNETAANGGFLVGPTAATAATLDFNSGSLISVAAGNTIQVGNTVPAGTANETLNAAGIVTNNGTLWCGRPGFMNVNSNAVWLQNADMSINGQGGYPSSLTINAGAAFTYTGPDTVKLNPGTANNAATANLTINGGVFTTSQGFEQTISGTVVAGELILSNGGTLVLSTNVPQLIASNTAAAALVLAGNGVINTAGFYADNADTATPITGPGGLTKAGAGTLFLEGADTYTGDTAITGGTLALTNGASLISTNLLIAGGASLDVSGLATPPLGLATGQTISNSTPAALINGSVNATSGALGLAYAAGTPALIVSHGTLQLAATTALNLNVISSPLGAGSYLLISTNVGGAVSGALPRAFTLSGNGLATGATASLGLTNARLYLVVVATVNTTPTNLTAVVSGGNLNLSWPLDHTGWRLLAQTNHLASGLSANPNDWGTVSNSASTNQVSIPMDATKLDEFYRLVYP